MWNEKKDYDTSGGTFHSPRNRLERTYTVAQTARIFAVDKRTIMKWLDPDESGDGVIPAWGWFRLQHSGYIRIRESALLKLQQEQ